MKLHFTRLLDQILSITLATMVLGCGLTKPQLAATQSFAKAAKSYPSAPATVITTYADVYAARRGFELSSETGAERAWNNSAEAAATYATEDSDAKKLSASLQIVSQYGDLLTQLSSNNFGQATEKAAGTLSSTIDNSIKQYNTESKSSVPSIGKYVASGVVALGDLYIQERQAEELKWYVNSAEPMIEKLTADMTSDLTDFKQHVLPGEECDIGQALCARQGKIAQMDHQAMEDVVSAIQRKSSRHRQPSNQTTAPADTSAALSDSSKDSNSCGPPSCGNQPGFLMTPETAELLIQTRLKIIIANQAIDSTTEATNQLAKAHQALNVALQQKETVGEAIEQIEEFVQAVSKANSSAKTATSSSASGQPSDSVTTTSTGAPASSE